MPDFELSGAAKIKIGAVNIEFSVPKGGPEGDPAARLAWLREEEIALRRRLTAVEEEIRRLQA